MIYYKTDEEIEFIRNSSLLVSNTLAEVAKAIKIGISSLQLDKLAEEFIRDHKAVPAFKDYKGFPNSLCMSPNDQVVHGIPNSVPLESGDIISVDCGVILNGYYGDSAYTFALGEVKPEVITLLTVTKQSLYLGIKEAVIGKRMGDLSFAIQNHTENQHKFGVVRELVGHGIGKSLHENPEVPNYGKRGSGVKLKEGLVMAIEPMVNLGTRRIIQHNDGWTITTQDKKPSAHYEHTIAIRKEGPDILSSYERIEAEEKNNPDLQEIEIKN